MQVTKVVVIMDPSGWEDCACLKVDTPGGQHSLVVRRPRDYSLLVLGLNAALQVGGCWSRPVLAWTARGQAHPALAPAEQATTRGRGVLWMEGWSCR
jgi:hypothetical protein